MFLQLCAPFSRYEGNQSFNNYTVTTWGALVREFDAPPCPIRKLRLMAQVLRKLIPLYALFQMFNAYSSPHIGTEISEHALRLHTLTGLPANHLDTSVEVTCAKQSQKTEQTNRAPVPCRHILTPTHFILSN